MERKTTEQFITEATKVHNGKYDYSNVEYVNNQTKVHIICPVHGDFWQRPLDHLKGRGCSKCNGGVIHSNDEWLEKFKKTHGDRYSYIINDEKLSANKKIKILCKKHGIFEQTCMAHSLGAGCPICANKENGIRNSQTKEGFIEKSRAIHGDKYDYSKVEYTNNHEKVCIICPIHGEFWQKPNVHLLNHGCPKCSSSHLEEEILKLLDENSINYIFQANKKILNWLGKQTLDFYLPEYKIAIECQGKQHFEPIAFFGGDKALKDTIKRDEKKKKLCEEHKVNILYYSNVVKEGIINDKKALLSKIINN